MFRNDQLLWVSAALPCFVMAYGTTSTFGLYYFKYVVRDEGAFPVFALAVGVG